MAKIYTIGEILVEIMRETEDSPLNETGRFLGPYPSGAPAIFISAVAQLGHQAKIWGGVGDDRFGDCLMERLQGDGVDCRHVVREDGKSTAVAFVAYDSSGEREFIFHIDGTPATSIRFDAGDAPTPDYFHVMGCSLMAGDAMRREINKAAEHYFAGGAKISFDPNIRSELLGNRSIWDVADPVMECCSIFLPGEEEIKLFTSSEGVEECIAELFDRFGNLEMIHLKKGKRGSEIHTRDSSVSVPVYPIEKVRPIVDPTGAGDTFDAAFLCGLAEGMSPADAGAYAAKAGAINSAAFGPMGGSMKELHDAIV